MSTNEDETLVDAETADQGEAPSADVTEAEQETETEQETAFRMSLDVKVEDIGPCRKHVRIKIPRPDIDHFYEAAVDEFAGNADVPGFRKGHVPKKLVGRRFRRELADDVKQKLLIGSLEQLADEADLDPINEPKLDVENIEVPEEGDFEYEFDVEVRPEFELPDYKNLEIERPTREVADEDVEGYLLQFLAQYGKRALHDGPAEKGDYVTGSVSIVHDGKTLRELSEMTIRLLPILRFRDAELEGFDELMEGVGAGETRETPLVVSYEAESLEMRGEEVQARFTVDDIKRLEMPELSKEFLQGIGVEAEDELRSEIRAILERQVVFQQRQATRTQVLAKITESADWELPEELVSKQVENALSREMLEMQQAGFTTQQIQARENELRQNAISSTRQAMKEHFVLDNIATEEDIEVTPGDIESELRVMALQSGESPRRLRAKLTKSGLIENLEAQIRERKAVDVVLEHAVFKDVDMERPFDDRVEAVDQSVCGTIVDVDVRGPAEESASSKP